MKEIKGHSIDRISCRQCGHITAMTKGMLTESQKLKFLCEACLESPVVENQVQHRRDHQGGRTVITEDLPNLD